MNFLYDGVSLQNGRVSNMDSLLLRERSIAGHNALLAVVCDGVGSTEGGAFAAAAAARMLSDWFGGLSSAERPGLRMRDAVAAINSRITRAAQAAGLRAASTLSALLLLEEMFYIVHAGDSRIYSCDQGLLRQLTRDDTSDSGRLTSCIGLKEEIVLYYLEGAAGGGSFLLCSDGLYKRMDERVLLAGLSFSGKKGLREALSLLTRHVIEQDERDNISLALVKIRGN